MDAQTIAAVATSAAAVAAWRSSWWARETTRRANLPFVWPAVRLEFDRDDRGEHPITHVWVRLHNDGPGLAQDVVAARLEPSDAEHPWSVHDRTPTIRALRGRETLPPEENDDLPLGAHRAGDDIFSIVVRWSDTGGQRWESIAPQDPESLARPPRRLRRRRWQRWRDPAEW